MSTHCARNIAFRLGEAKHIGPGSWKARCPAHDDHDPSLSLKDADGKVLVYCHTGCSQDAVIAALRAQGLWPVPPSPPAACNSAIAGLSLQEYAEAKRLPISFLREIGLRDGQFGKVSAVEVPYFDEEGKEVATRYRIALHGKDRFRWRKGDAPTLYGLDRLPRGGSIVLVEGESDAQTLLYQDIPAIGLPGASLWNDRRDARHLGRFETIYVVLEPDAGGKALERSLLESEIAGKVKAITLPRYKDVSAMFLADPDGFKDRWPRTVAAALPLVAQAEKRLRREREVRRRASVPGLAFQDNILDRFGDALADMGVVGVREAVQLLYLVMTSRLLDHPVSMAIKGPSSGGKSFMVEIVLKFFPAHAYRIFTSMSERALVYSKEPLSHRMLIMAEAAGMTGEFASYLIRSLLSEGRLSYEVTVPDGQGGYETRRIEREGPTGLIVTTTAVKLHPENETRLISINVADTPAQTRAILKATARPHQKTVDLVPWLALQEHLQTGPRKVHIPFADALAAKTKAVSVRLRRDFKALLTLVAAHALLHQEQRGIHGGTVNADIDDYAAVHRLVGPYIQEGVEATVPPAIRQVVEAVNERQGHYGASLAVLAEEMGLDKSSVQRRAKAAAMAGYIKNLEDRPRQPARYVLGDPLPDEIAILPAPEEL